ncbi:hypothetical protein KY290_011771 [Solanum tuberosum]|uniref:Uncharacterized protein n=1 Tax=Solanum tuberosum TaxID=4113 RepID=A0ABQ7W1L9_SOLTU|nr:hypothetical protein KY290_011771 [Solanum tuberosum]
MKRILMMSFGSKWKESKHEVKTIGYDPYNIDIERLAHCPDRVEEDQWRSLVHYWSSKEAKVPDNPLEDCQQPSSLVPGVHTRKVILDQTLLSRANYIDGIPVRARLPRS